MPSDPAHLTRLDNNDTAFNTWVITWVAHQAFTDPLNLFNAPIFYPSRNALAFSEHMVTQGVMSAPLHWAGFSPVTVYNVMVWLGYALSAFSMALLIRAWTGSVPAASVAACLYGFNAHLLTRYAHLQALHLEFFPLVLFTFDRVLRGGGTIRDVLLLATMFVVQSLCSYYTMVMAAAALVVAFIVRAETWQAPRRVWLSMGAAAVIVAVALTPFLVPYYSVRQEQGLVRTIEDVRHYSAGWRDYLATASRLHYALWSHRYFDGSAVLFPGLTGALLTVVALVSGVAWRDARARMALAFGTLGILLSFGASLPAYEWLQSYFTVLQAIRAASRWGLLFLIAVAILSGFAVASLQKRWGHRRWWPAFAAALVIVSTLEALRAPLVMEPFDGIRTVHARLASEPITAMVVFPLYGGNEFNQNARYLLDQTRHWKPMLNAYSSFAPPLFYELATTLQTFPAASALQALRTHGFSHVLLHRAPLERDYGASAVDALRAHDDLQFVFEQDGVILYRLR
jgi:hypothetical protein